MIVKVTINGNEYEVSDGKSVLQTCRKLGVFIPHLCYLEDADPSGVCGLCVIELEGGKVALSCLTPIKDGMKIKTTSARLNAIRKSHLDRILDSHNINCLNCSKNGSCKLQAHAMTIYNSSQMSEHEDRRVKFSEISRLSKFIYDGSKCVGCNKCVKFLSNHCNKELKKISGLTDLGENNDMAYNVEELCPTDALTHAKGIRPEFLQVQNETFDINDVFTPKIMAYTNDEKIEQVKSTDDSFISDNTRLSLKKIPKRVHDEENYQKVIKLLSDKLKAETHEKNAFIIGDNLDIVSLFYIKAFAEYFPNVCVCTNACQFPKDTDLTIGITKSELPSMDCALFMGNMSDLTRYHITSYSSRIKETVSFEFADIDSFFEKHDEINFANCNNPMLFAFITEFEKNIPEITVRKLKDFADRYFSKYAKILKIKILPSNLSQMLMDYIPDKMPLSSFLEKYNRHDLQFICVVGDLDYDLNLDGVFTIYHSVNKYEGCEYIPAKHFVEDETYHLNVFGEMIKTKKVLTNDLKSHREFLFDLMGSVFEERFADINDEVHRSIRKSFFD